MKKKLLYIAAIVICLSLITGGTYAYYTAVDTARNVITTGGVDIVIEHWQQTPNGQIPDSGESIAVMPATDVSKIVTVRNADAPCFIRAKLALTLRDAEGETMAISAEAQDRIIHLMMNTEDSTEKDGWWYYSGAVDTDGVTEPLMSGISFDGPNMTNEYQSCTLTVDVVAQAVQAANNNTSALEAMGWPET